MPPGRTQEPRRLSRAQVLSTVWPIILANASAPLLGLADTAVIGRTGSIEALGAIALGSLIFSFVYWTFGFLRMTTTGFVAQAEGAGSEGEVRLATLRPVLLGLALGVILWLMQTPILTVAVSLLDGTPEVERLASSYFSIRIWGAPGALATFAVVGTLIGLGLSRLLLFLQLFINGLNIILDVVLAGYLAMGVRGVALGTAVAEWVGFLAGIGMLIYVARRRESVALDWKALWDWDKLRGMFGAQLDIMLRTLLLLAGFAWFTNQSARFGDEQLAANHILLQLVSFSAFVLDGFAFATESLVGKAQGRQDRAFFDHALRLTTELALLSALLLATSLLIGGRWAVAALTDLQAVRLVATSFLPYAAVYVALSVGAFQLDGVFIGTTRTRAMRDASFLAMAGFLGLSHLLVPRFGNQGLWLAFIGYVILRALTLGVRVPALRRTLEAR